MRPFDEPLPRRILGTVRDAVASFRVVVVNGPRQAGKSTLLHQLRVDLGGTILNLDDERLREAALADPAGLLLADSRIVYVDEVQRGGDPLVRAIKVRADDATSTTTFVLAGSTNFLTVPTLSESLAGRAVLLEVWPFSQGELTGKRESLLDTMLGEPSRLASIRLSSPPDRDSYFTRICAGGFPEATRLPEGRTRNTWFRSYVQTVTQRDIIEISRVRQAEELPRLLRFLAAKTSQELVKAELAGRTGLDRGTVANYLPLLETVFLCRELPAWSRNPLGKVTKHPKIHLTDTGLAAWLLGVNPTGLSQPLSPVRGQLVETFVHNEILKQRAWSDSDVGLYHWRDREGPEVDLVLETPDGGVVGVESKAALNVSRFDFKALARLRDKLGDQFQHGIVFYLGQDVLSFGPGLTALPLAALWS